MRYVEDLQSGDVALGSTFVVERDEMVEFARRWDPQPFHLDDAVANEVFGEGGVTAPGVFVMAIRTRLLHETPDLAVIAALGYDELRFALVTHSSSARSCSTSECRTRSQTVVWRGLPSRW